MERRSEREFGDVGVEGYVGFHLHLGYPPRLAWAGLCSDFLHHPPSVLSRIEASLDPRRLGRL